jgi:hypothetical protein
VGGIGTKAKAEGIDRKINWIGVRPKKRPFPGGRGPLVTFERFRLFEENGPDFGDIAPGLAKRLSSSAKGSRFLFYNFSDADLDRLLAIPEAELRCVRSTVNRGQRSRRGKCGPRRC